MGSKMGDFRQNESDLDQFVQSLSRRTLSQTLSATSNDDDAAAVVRSGLAARERLDQFRAMQVTAAAAAANA